MTPRPSVVFHDFHPKLNHLLEEVLAGLTQNPKTLPPKLFYDRRGAELFEDICQLEEYYLTRTEVGILRKHSREMASNHLSVKDKSSSVRGFWVLRT